MHTETTTQNEQATQDGEGARMPHSTMTATYSPEDNKLRLYSLTRLPSDLYARVKAAGFSWAPKQEVFVAPMWTPGREDFLLELCGEIGDEDTSLVDRAEQRAERFEDYSEKRAEDAGRARDGVAAITEYIPFGQPILVGHHSEKHARKDAERIENGMRRAVRMWETSNYWKDRAAGALAHAKYKERPDVRARRIKTIEADQRKMQRSRDAAAKALALWMRPGLTHEEALQFAGGDECGWLTLPRKEGDAPDFNGKQTAYGALSGSSPRLFAPRTLAEIVEVASRAYPRTIAHCERWMAHHANRLTYERAMLAESGYTPPPPKATKAALPLLNYAGEVKVRNPYRTDEANTYTTVDMTSEQWARINKDYKGSRVSADGTHRVRIAVRGGTLSAVFITDAKAHPRPGAVGEQGETREQQEVAARIAKGREKIEGAAQRRKAVQDANAVVLAAHRGERRTPVEDTQSAAFEAMRSTLREGGVQVVSAPQLFPTPPDLAERAAALADIEPGDRVLEPSAGTGNLLRAIGDGPEKVAVEINAALVQQLARLGLSGLSVHQGDFLDFSTDALGIFDRIVMNPPFADAADIAYILHARKFLRPGGRLVAFCANGPRQNERLAPLVEQLGGTWEELEAGAFESSGTGVRAVLLSFDD